MHMHKLVGGTSWWVGQIHPIGPGQSQPRRHCRKADGRHLQAIM